MLSSQFARPIIAGLVFGAAAITTAFAANIINNITSGSINNGDTVGAGWYQAVNERIVPSGTIIAFDLASCPAGWTEFTTARGRTIIGAGQGATLTNRAAGSTGGNEEVNLAANQIPSLAGNIIMDATPMTSASPPLVQVAPWQTTWLKNAGVYSGTTNLLKGLFTTTEPSVGSGAYIPVSFTNPSQVPVSLMQPYIALLYCKKD